MPRYQVTGIPLAPPFEILQGRSVGDTFEADLDESLEQALVGAGALSRSAEPAVEAEPEPKPATQLTPPIASATTSTARLSARG